MRQHIITTALAALLVALPTYAQAQSTPLDTRGATSALPSFVVTAPLRLTLQNGIIPQGGANPNCATREEAAGNTVGGIPVGFHQSVQLAPRLVLAGFSQLGCPIDSSIGGVIAHVTPITSSIALVISGGIIIAPGQLPLYGNIQSSIASQSRGKPSATGATVRADFMWKTKSGRIFSIGASTTGVRHALTFGGGF